MQKCCPFSVNTQRSTSRRGERTEHVTCLLHIGCQWITWSMQKCCTSASASACKDHSASPSSIGILTSALYCMAHINLCLHKACTQHLQHSDFSLYQLLFSLSKLLWSPRKLSLREIVLTQRYYCSQNAVTGSGLCCPYTKSVLTSSVHLGKVAVHQAQPMLLYKYHTKYCMQAISHGLNACFALQLSC